jgi:transcriptional regulator with XRE-family HTH domain
MRKQLSLVEQVRIERRMPSPATAKVIRRTAGVSLERMADEIGVDRATLMRWENGENRPRPAHCAKWAALLDELQQVLAAR